MFDLKLSTIAQKCPPAWVRWLLLIVWMAIIYGFSDQPNSNEVTKMYFGGINFWVRKVAHVSEYAILFLLCRLALFTYKPAQQTPRLFGLSRQSSIALVVALLYACSDELHQSYVAGRSGSPIDVGIDLLGPLLLIAVAVITRSRQTSTTENE